jgi:hypothetical protein
VRFEQEPMTQMMSSDVQGYDICGTGDAFSGFNNSLVAQMMLLEVWWTLTSAVSSQQWPPVVVVGCAIMVEVGCSSC